VSAANQTPMMQQYLGVKARYGDAIVLFRMGDFFETFFEDAEVCAKLLGITLTARSKEKDVPMAGVPHHAIDGYVARLIGLGRKVVLVDQVEDPRRAKGLVRRAVTRVLTPGTFLDPQASAREVAPLAAVCRGTGKKHELGLAVLELSTGQFVATSVSDRDALEEELSRLGVRELLGEEGEDWGLSVPFSARPRGERVGARSRLEAQFGADELRGLELALSPQALDAAGMVLAYVDATQLLPEAQDLTGRATLDHVARLVPYVATQGLVLDGLTREHLELFSARGEGGRSFLDCIDETRSPAGARRLRAWLGRPLDELARIAERADAVERLCAHPSVLDEARDATGHMPDLERLLARVALGRAHPKELRALADGLRAAGRLLDALRPVLADELVGEAGRLQTLVETDRAEDLLQHLEAALESAPPTDPAEPGVFRMGFDERLDRSSELSFQGKRLIAELEAKEKAATGISSLKIRHNKVFGYYIEVTKANLHLAPERFIRKQTTVNAERFFTDELKKLEDEVSHAEERRQERAWELFRELMAGLAPQIPRLRTLVDAAAEADVLAGLAYLAERRAWCRPRMVEEDVLDVEEGRHPVLEALTEELGERFVPNDIRLDAGERLLILTGPNMAGKSTVMRQTALIAILAHMGAFVPAQRATVGRIDRIFTRVGAGDELSKGRSTFMVEMNETANILRAATDRSLVLLDEIGRGTSTFDGLSIAWAVAEHLHDVVGAKTLFATHYHELTEIGRSRARAGNRHVAVRERGDRIVFLRKLEKGGANRSYGVQVARLAGLPAPVVARARALLERLERGQPLGPSDQLDLFEGPAEAPNPNRELAERILGLDLDELSPREAHQLLVELQDALRQD
jgi:DNA mismatch repair protein MutS